MFLYWIVKSERIRKRILRFFTKQINPRSLGSWYIKGTKESTLDSSVPLTHHDPRDLGLETQNPFSDSFGFKNPILDFLYEMHPKQLDYELKISIALIMKVFLFSN